VLCYLLQVKAERDELEKDVENLCMQNGNASIFSRSAVLSERIYSTDKELAKAKKQVFFLSAFDGGHFYPTKHCECAILMVAMGFNPVQNPTKN
jgi:hypothetical protein